MINTIRLTITLVFFIKETKLYYKQGDNKWTDRDVKIRARSSKEK